MAQNVSVSENSVPHCTPKPNGFADHYPYEKWLFHWEYTQHFQTNPCINSWLDASCSRPQARRKGHAAGGGLHTDAASRQV